MVFGPSVYDVPLLPYEKELIKTIGLTEEEYRKFAAEVRRRGMVRPAAYDHIPDIRCEPATTTAILVNLAISLVLTGVAYLLTPKPKMPRAKGGGTVDLGDITGPSRFTPSRGFETLAELGDYQSAIPLIFGRYDATQEVGGMLVTPKLVWSRMFSHGPMQRASLMFVVGEQGIGGEGIGAPEESGIFLGNNALDAVYRDFYAFYWKNETQNQAEFDIVNDNYVYGDPTAETASKKAPGDRVFVCPGSGVDRSSPAFCHAYSPANNTEFGIYAPIANGTGYRLNYEIVNAVDQMGLKALRQALTTRIKIAGCKNEVDKGSELEGKDFLVKLKDEAQDSFGRNYSPRMGIVSVKRKTNSELITTDDDAGELQKDVAVEVGDTATFVISKQEIPEDFYRRRGRGEGVGDINATVQSMQFAADDAMQPGELFAIGGTVWKVIERSLGTERFDPDRPSGDSQKIKLECIEVENALDNTIGVISKKLVLNPDKHYIGDTFDNSKGRQTISEVFFPLTKIATGIVRNNRPAVVTEIGFKSTVYQRLRGICAFNSLPTPTEIKQFQEDKLQVRTGTITSVIPRVSVFQVLIRKAGTDDKFEAVQGTESGGGLMLFAVRGSTPVAQYNFIRFKLTEPQELEFKFVPISGAELRRTEKKKVLVDLSHAPSSKPDSFTTLTAKIPGFGKINVEVSGLYVTRDKVTKNKEFFREYTVIEEEDVTRYPTEVAKSDNLPAKQKGAQAEKIEKVSNAGIANISSGFGKAGAFAYALLEEAGIDETKRQNKKELEVTTREVIDGRGRWIEVKWFFIKLILGSTHYARQNGIEWSWFVDKVKVKGSFAAFSQDEVIEIKRGGQSTNADLAYPSENYKNSNPFRQNNPGGTLNWSGLKFKVTNVGASVEIKGRAQAYRYELFGDANDFEKGETKLKTISITGDNNSSQEIKLKLTCTAVKSTDDSFGQNKEWGDFSVEIKQDEGTTQNWQVGDTARHLTTVSESNPYKTVYPEVGAIYRIGCVDIDKGGEVVETEATFASSSQLSDISHYRDLVDKSNATTPEHEIVYVNEVQENANDPTFKDLTLAGLSLKAGRQFTALDQLRVWLGNGIQVERLHKSVQQDPVDTEVALDVYGTTEKRGPSSLFSDLVFYLLTDQVGGAGALLGMTRKDAPLVDKQELIKTSSFLHKQKLFFNGPITDRTNLRQFIADFAPYFLCNFIVSNGKFSLKPALPVKKSGNVNKGPVEIEQIFTKGNILEDTFKVEYLGAEERRPFQAVVRYRQEKRNKLPEEKTITIKALGSEYNRSNVDILPLEQFDLTQFCTSKHHAELVARYFLSLRQLVTHTISFSTTLEGLGIQAGSFIQVVTEASPYNSANTGTIDSNGNVTSVRELPSGQYVVDYFATDSDDIERDTMEVTNGVVTATQFHGSVFTLVNETVSRNIYVVEQLTFSQEGTVDIVASEHPCDDEDRSLLVDSIYNGSYTIDGKVS